VWFPQVFVYALSAVVLAWLLRDYDFRQLGRDFRTLDWKWVALAVVSDLAVYVSHGWRWKVLLAPVAKLRFWRTVQAIYIGLFANEILPLRPGEIIRCFLMAEWHDLRLSLAFSSAALERIIDGVWMLAAFFVTAAFVRSIPGEITLLVQAISVLLLAGIVVLFWVVRRRHHAHAVIRESRWSATLRHVIEGLQLMGNLRTLIFTAAVSLLYLALQVLTVWALMKAYALDYSFWVAGGVVIIMRLATVVPNAPGNLGVINAACVMALGLFDLRESDAKTFSLLYWAASTLPLLIGGAIATALTGVNIGELRNRARERAAQRHQADAAPPPHPDTVA
jgi:glycosyltransferase 2 family protein